MGEYESAGTSTGPSGGHPISFWYFISLTPQHQEDSVCSSVPEPPPTYTTLTHLDNRSNKALSSRQVAHVIKQPHPPNQLASMLAACHVR